MCRRSILMIMTFIGFIFFLANLSVTECAGNKNDGIASRKIFVGGLWYGTTDATLRSYFEQFGEVKEAVIIKDRETDQSRGFGFVLMKDKVGAVSAVNNSNKIIDKRKVDIHLAAKRRNLPPRLRLRSKNKSRQFQRKIYNNFIPKFDGQRENAHIQPGNLSSLSPSATPYVPQASHWSRSATPVLTHIQPSIPLVPLVPLANARAPHYNSQNLHWPRMPTPLVPLIQPSILPMNLPPLASGVVNSQIQNNHNLYQDARIRSSMPINQPSLYAHVTNGALPARTKVTISKPSITKSKQTPTVDQSLEILSQNQHSTLNTEEMSKEYSDNNSNQREDQQNLHFGTIDYAKFIENEGATKKFDATTIKEKAELIGSEKEDIASMKESSWGDSIEEDDLKKKGKNDHKKDNKSS